MVDLLKNTRILFLSVKMFSNNEFPAMKVNNPLSLLKSLIKQVWSNSNLTFLYYRKRWIFRYPTSNTDLLNVPLKSDSADRCTIHRKSFIFFITPTDCRK